MALSDVLWEIHESLKSETHRYLGSDIYEQEIKDEIMGVLDDIDRIRKNLLWIPALTDIHRPKEGK